MRTKVFPLAFMLTVFLITQVKCTNAAAYENFTSYTEVDPNNHITIVSATQVDYSFTRGETAYLVKDYGSGYFKDFEHEWDTQLVNTGSGSWRIEVCYALSNSLGSSNSWTEYISVRWYFDGSNVRLYLLCTGITTYTTALTYNTWYYMQLTKSGTSVILKIYSNVERTNLITTLSGTLTSNYSFRYIYGCASFNDGVTSIIGSAKTRNLNLKFGAYVKLYHNQAGKIVINGTYFPNGTTINVPINSTLTLIGAPNTDYAFKSFNWTGGNTVINNYNLTVSANNTIYCYFTPCTASGYDQGYEEGFNAFKPYAVIIAIVISLIVILIAMEKRG